MVDHNGCPVKSSDIVNNAVESSEVVQSESVAVATPKRGSQGSCKRAAANLSRAYIDSFIQRVDETLTVDTRACDVIVFHQLFEKISDDHRPQLLEVHPREVLVMNY